MSDLSTTLKTVFGYDAFRPHQREIMEASLAGKDVLALLPTGGGKSLCFQVPALHRTGLTVVVSPLVALMKDQVDQLQAAGVSATFLNSTLGVKESRSRLAGLHRNEWRLLYVSPERILLDNWEENLKAWNVEAIAIDEAHCISEWGHDFRPEYRQLSRLRDWLPEAPVMALTATATDRVRDDILKLLRLRDPFCRVASFNRPNLSYKVITKDSPQKQLLQFIRQREDESGIVYCTARATTEKLAEALVAKGFKAVAYHAGMSNGDRTTNQELFLRDDARIVCATIAFGMGINKPNVRWVVHYDMPKNLAGYYQETGRAGRDGLPGDCLLLHGRGDIAKQMHFIDEMNNAKERATAKQQLFEVVNYAESLACRRAHLLQHFGEQFPLDNCGACDNCTESRETYDGGIVALKLLSCVYRVRQASPFGAGLQHLVDILLGADTEAIRRRGHDRLSTYGIGKEDLDRSGWLSAGRELLKLGLLVQAEGEYPTMELSPEGMLFLKNKPSLQLTKAQHKPKASKAIPKLGAESCDEILFHQLKILRKRLADDLGKPAYVICGDASLRQMAREYPTTIPAMSGIFGMGEKKLERYGETFASTVETYLQTNSRMSF